MLFVHDKIHDVVVSCIGKNFVRSLIKYAEYSFIENRIRLQLFDTEESGLSAVIVLIKTCNEQFFGRLLKEIRHGNQNVFENINFRNPGCRKAFIDYLREHLTESDFVFFKKPLFLSSKFGYEDFASFIVKKWKEEFKSKFRCSQTDSPLYVACLMGHFNIVKLLVESSIEIDAYMYSQEPIATACANGYRNIVELLLTHSVYSDLSMALENVCKIGNTELVELLLKKGTFDSNGPLCNACKNGHFEIVKILLGNNLLFNDNDDINTRTPLYFASMKGHIDIVKLLLNEEAKVKDCDISVAEWNDHEDIAECLREHLSLQKGEDIL